MTIEQAIKKYKLSPVDPSTAAQKRRELNVDDVLYMSISPKKTVYIVTDVLGTWLYTTERTFYSHAYKETKRVKLTS